MVKWFANSLMDFQNDPNYIEVIGWLQRNYPTAANATDADEFLSTNEITQALNLAFSKFYTADEIHSILLDQNYNSVSLGTMKRCWIIKKNTNA